MALPTTFVIPCDPGTAARFERMVRDRYGEPLYEHVAEAAADHVEVLLNVTTESTLWVADAPRHTALTQSLAQEFGVAARMEFRKVEELAAPYEVLRFRVSPTAQKELFERDLEDLPDFIEGFFPIVDPESGCQIVLDAIEPISIANPYTTAWCLDGCFRLVDAAGSTTDQLDNYGFGRFYEPVDNGRGKEMPGHPMGRPYDEVALVLRRFLQDWCGRILPRSLRACAAEGKRTLSEIFEAE